MNKAIPHFHIRRARPAEADALTKLALVSKAHWPYPKEYLEKCVGALVIDSDYIENWPVFCAVLSDKIIGFFSLKIIQEEKRLDNLWILPEYIGKKIGTELFNVAVLEAKNLDWRSFRLAADPFAKGFYLKMGAKEIGVVQSKVKPDLFLEHMEYEF